MPSRNYDAWHTLTVEHDGEDEDGAPMLDFTLDHPDCPPGEPLYTDGPFVMVRGPRCHLGQIIDEWGHMPDEYGIPTEPGEYRLRAWFWPGDGYVSEPDEGIEVEAPECEHHDFGCPPELCTCDPVQTEENDRG
ncbi:hypothetical protein [Nocardia salmonicida]|uniref:hypothetical protein n=1 Tax=Nocardia salmonicida TaxID=53431 RepID=UPI003635C6C1